MKHWRKVRNSMVNRRLRCSPCWAAQRALTGNRRAHHAFRLQASDAMVIYAKLSGIATDAGKTPGHLVRAMIE